MLISVLFHYMYEVGGGKAAKFGELYLRLFMPSINLIIFPAVQALTSNDLRDHVFSLDFLKELSYNIHCKFKMGPNDAEVGDAHDIELQALGNNDAPVSGSNNSSVGSLFDKRTVSCSFPHELCSTKTKAPRLGDLPKSYSL